MKKRVLLLLVALCCTIGHTVTLAESTQEDIRFNPVIQTNNDGIMPMTMYYIGNSIEMARPTGYARIYLATMAVTTINHIYHDVTIYKNGALYMSNQRYSDWNCFRLDTTINVPAKSGDYIEVYLDSYTDHNGCLESGNASELFVY